MANKLKSVKCEKCGLEFPESTMSENHKDKAFIWKDKLLCEDCLVMMGGDPRTVETLWSFQKEDKAKPHDW
jgi:NAD-dependent SIR2 family protein deacetylase